MGEIKFSCQHCGQHISCDEAWSGHSIECPACHAQLLVPQTQAPPAPANTLVRESPRPSGPRLTPGATQVARSTAHAPAPGRKIPLRRPRGQNALLQYGLGVVVVVALAALGYFYLLPLLTSAVQPEPGAQTSAGQKTTQSGGTMGGPMGEVSGAMDVSETLDGGGSSAKARPIVSTNRNARPRPAAPPR